MRGHDSYAFSSLAAANSPPFALLGGAYVVDAVGAWGGGSVTLQRLGPDGSTYITAVAALTADGTSDSVALPSGTYRFLIATAAGVSVAVLPVPGE